MKSSLVKTHRSKNNSKQDETTILPNCDTKTIILSYIELFDDNLWWFLLILSSSIVPTIKVNKVYAFLKIYQNES